MAILGFELEEEHGGAPAHLRLVGRLRLARVGRLPLHGPASPAPKAQGEQPPIFFL